MQPDNPEAHNTQCSDQANPTHKPCEDAYHCTLLVTQMMYCDLQELPCPKHVRTCGCASLVLAGCFTGGPAASSDCCSSSASAAFAVAAAFASLPFCFAFSFCFAFLHALELAASGCFLLVLALALPLGLSSMKDSSSSNERVSCSLARSSAALRSSSFLV